MSSHSDALASVYARSLYELAQDAGGQAAIDEVAGELEQIAEVLRREPRVREFFSSPVIDKSKRGAALRRTFERRASDLMLRFLLLLNENGRLGHLEHVAAAMDRLVQEAFGRVEVDVFTAAPIDRAQLDSVRQRIKQALNKEPVLHPYTEPSMMGGLKLRIGDQLIDGSVATRLKRMRRDLQGAGGAKLRQRMNRIIGEGS